MHLPPFIAAFFCLVGIVGLFWLDRDLKAQTSKAFWIPTAWLMIICSRPVSMWLGMSPTGGLATVYLEGSPIDAAVYMVLVAAGMTVVIARKEQVGPILGTNWPTLLFFTYAACSVIWSDFPVVTMKHWIKGVGDVAMVLIVLTEPCVTDAIQRLVTRVGFLHLPLSVLFIKYYPDLGRNLSKSWTLDYGGVTTGKNELGILCLISGLGILWRFRSAYNDREDGLRRQRLLALGTVLGMAVWLLWTCNSMTSICALSMAGAVMLLSTRPSFCRRPALVHALVVTVVFTSIFVMFVDRSAVTVLGRDATFTGRTEIWAGVLSIPNNRLLGAGYESFWLGPRLPAVWGLVGMEINEAHNGYIEMLLNLGWIGVALLGLLIATGYRRVIGALGHDPDYGGMRLAYFLAALIASLTEAAFRMLDARWVFFLLGIIAPQVVSAPEASSDEVLAEYRLECGQDYAADIREGESVGIE